MKYLYSLSLALLCSVAALAQPIVLFTENFDPGSGPDSVSAGTINPGPNSWHDTSFLATSKTHSFHVQGSMPNSQVYFDTDPFSTIANPYVHLTFDHIAKLYWANQAKLLISKDNGVTFDTLSPAQYFGPSIQFKQLGYFNSASYSYAGTNGWKHTSNSTTPNATWWRSEIFDLTGIASDTSGPTFTGYPSVIIRFIVDFSSPAPGGFPAGWFVDNIKVTGSNCEFTPPQLEFLSSQSSNCDGHNFGVVPPLPSFNFKVFATDDTLLMESGMDSVRLSYSVNGGPFASMKMPQSAPDAYEVSLSSFVQGDTVRYFIQAYDLGCPSAARLPKDPSQYEEMIVDGSIPSKCPSSACTSPLIINSFPWIENFEGSEWKEVSSGGAAAVRGEMPIVPDGPYVVAPDLLQTYGWSLKSGATPTPDTGPDFDADRGAGGGGKYLYSEFSNRNQSLAPTTFITPCVDLRDSVAKNLSFYYHMYGSDINRLRIDIDTGSTTADFYNNYFSIVNQQQLSSADAWARAVVDLSAFAGKIIRIRFAVIASQTSGDLQDIGIDRLKIQNSLARDLEVTELISGVNTLCSATSNIPVQAVVTNMGQTTLDTIPMAYQLDNGTIQRDTLFSAGLITADSLIFTFSQNLSFNGQVSHVLKAWSELSNDQLMTNDTLVVNIDPRPAQSINGPFYFQDFKSGSYGEWMPTGKWDEYLYSNNDNYLGPNVQYTRSGEYLYTSEDGAELQSVCVSVSSMTNPVLSLAYSTYNAEIIVRIKPYGQPWQNIGTTPLVPTLNGRKFKAQHMQIDLTPYKGSSFLLAFEVNESSSGDLFAALDYVQISEESATDIALTDVNKTLSKLLENDTSIPNMWFTGGSVGTGPFSYSFNVSFQNLCKSAPAITGSVSYNNVATGNPIDKSGFTLNLSDSLDAGRYLVKAWLETAGDINSANDTIEMQAVVAPTLQPPYFQDFDQCQYDFRTASPLEQWEIKNPVNITPYSGSRAAVLNDFNALRGTENLLSPIFKVEEPVFGAELRFYHTYNFQTNGFGEVEIFNKASWTNITDKNPTLGVNFPTSFTGSQGWQMSSYPLPEFTKVGTYAFRFVAETVDSSGNGWAIDDFEIYVPAQHSASPRQNVLLGNLIPTIGNNQLTFTLRNTGAAPLDEATVSVVLNGTTQFSENFNFRKLQAGNQIQLTFTQPLVLNQQNNSVQIITSLPNGEQDELPSDDTLSLSLNLLPFYSSTPQCLDFEQSGELVGINKDSQSLSDFWKWTTPAKNFISSAHGGTKAWVTADSTYGALADDYLYTPSYAVTAGQCYRFSFWHNYNTEYNFDGGTVEFTRDNGNTWSTLGEYGDTTWYNTPYVQALDAIYPGFSGNSNGWRFAFSDFKSFYADTVQFRFRFASGATQHGEGWAIDDLCFKSLAGPCDDISSEENELLTAEVNLYPNPAEDMLYLAFSPFVQALTTEVELGIYDQNGKLLKQWSQSTSSKSAARIDISMLPKGVYLLKSNNAQDAAAHFVKRFIKM